MVSVFGKNEISKKFAQNGIFEVINLFCLSFWPSEAQARSFTIVKHCFK